MTFRCNFCDRDFQRETTLAVHMCEQKRRYQEREEVGVSIGFQAYLRFYEITQGSARLKTWDDFAKSAFYRAFVKFGRHVVAIRAINVPRFTDWLIRGNRKIDHWCQDQQYQDFLVELVRTEAAADAVARAREQALDWSEKTGNPAHDYLRFGNTNAVCYAVTTGRITPWVLYNTASGEEFLSNLNAEQITMIWPMIDTDFWHRRLQDYASDAEWVRGILTREGW